MNVESKLVDASAVAEAMGIRSATVRRWANQGLIPVVRISSRTVRFDLADVLAAIRKMAQSQQTIADSRRLNVVEGAA